MNCKIVYTSQVKCTIRGLSLDTKKYLFNKYSFFVPSARFSPLYKLGRWNGKVSYFTELGSTYISLLSEIVPYLENEGYEIEYEYMTDKYDFNFTDIDETYLNEYVWNKGHRFEGQPVQLFDHQVNIVNSFLHNPKSIIEAATGCHSKGTKILMFDGSWKNVEDIMVGDKIMGDDGTKRTVLNLHRGTDEMFKIIPNKGKPFIVNGGHILPVICNNKNRKDYMKVTNISVYDYLNKSKYYKHTHKIYSNKTVINWNKVNELNISSYIMGVLLGDGSFRNGCSITTMDNEIISEIYNESSRLNMDIRISGKENNKAKTYHYIQKYKKDNDMISYLKKLKLFNLKSEDKFIPDIYKFSSIESRLQLLAGLIDTDGSLCNNYFEYYTKSKQLAEDVSFVAHSLGLKAYIHTKKVKTYPENDYYTVSICGNIEIIPTKIKRKKTLNKNTNKDSRHSGFSIEALGMGEYYGFEVDKNNLYIMEDWWVQHNSGKTLICFALAKQILKYGKMIIVEPSADLTVQTANLFNNLGIPAGIVGLGKREFNNPVIIATWQTINSISKKSKKDKIKKISKDALTEDEIDQLVDGVVAVMCDETHQVKATEIQKIFTNIFKDIPLRWGLTGTIPKSKEDYFPLITALGPVVYQVDSKELQEKEILSHCNINIINMEDKSKFESYDEEIKYLASNKNKILFEAQLINGIVNTGNTLVLIQRLETGEKLIEELKKLGREAVFLSGKDKSDIRFKNYKEMNEGNNKLIIATSQIASTGLDIPRIFNLVYIDMGKSFVKTIQSIGRGLRVFTDKNNVNIYDICSDTKFSKRHTKQRIEYYIEKQYPWKMLKIENWKTE